MQNSLKNYRMNPDLADLASPTPSLSSEASAAVSEDEAVRSTWPMSESKYEIRCALILSADCA